MPISTGTVRADRTVGSLTGTGAAVNGPMNELMVYAAACFGDSGCVCVCVHTLGCRDGPRTWKLFIISAMLSLAL